jgi:TniQ
MSTRPLPRSLDPLPGESLNGYLLRLSCRLRVSPLHLAQITGCAGGRQSFIGRRALFHLDVQRFARAARLTGGEAAALTAASWTGRYPPIGRSQTEPGRRLIPDGWLTATSIRYCPQCLAGDGSPAQQQYGGPWKKTWLLPVIFACTEHQRFLREDCPREHSRGYGAWALIASPAASGLHPAQCRLPPQGGKTGRNRSSCDMRLDRPGEDGLPAPDRGTLDVQERILALLSPQHPAPDAARAFMDLRVISTLVCLTWPLGEDLMDARLAAAVSGYVRAVSTGGHQSLDRQPRGIPATAGILAAAAAITGTADLESTLASYITPGKWHTDTTQNWKHILSRHQNACSPALRDTALAITASRTTDRRKPKRTPM